MKCCRSPSFLILDISIRSGNIRAQSGKRSKIAPNLACFGPQFSGGKVLDRDYKIEHASDHVAKFRSDRLRDLGDLTLKIKEKLL